MMRHVRQRAWLTVAVTAFAAALVGCAEREPSGSTVADASADPLEQCTSGISGTGGAPPPSNGASAIIAQGTCRVDATGADRVTVTVVVQVPATSQSAALAGAIDSANGVTDALRRKNVGPSDIRQGVLQVVPVSGPILASPNGIGGTRVTGYEGSKVITITVRDPQATEGIISEVINVTGAAGQLHVSYSVDNPIARAQARAAAVRQAQAKAQQLADAAGVPLGRLISIIDVPQAQPATPRPVSSVTLPNQGGTPPVAPATDDGRDMNVSVDVVYAIE